jgi:hypothetical protein
MQFRDGDEGTCRHAFAYCPQIAGAGRDFPLEALLEHNVEQRYGQRGCQFGTGLAIPTLAAVETDGEGSAARCCRIAVHQGGKFVVGQPDLRHAGVSRSLNAIFPCSSDFLFNIGHSNDKKHFYIAD